MKWIGALVLRLMFVGSSSSETSESMFLDLDLEEESTKLTMIAPREKGVLYDVTHYQNALYVVTNRDGATNFKIVTTTLEKPGPENWKDVFPYDPKIKFDGFSAFKDFAILEGREGGFSQLWIFQGNEKKRVEFEEDSYDVNSSVNKEYETDTHRLVYSSLTTPPQTIDLNVKTGARTLLKEEPVLNFDRSAYQSKRIEATAEDGTVVPISLVYKKDLLTDGKGPKPCYLYGYGSYEISIDPSFHRTFLPIVDRNVVVAIAHIRGGGEMGRLHYEDAKYLKKKNTFTDFVTCAEKLIADGITAPDRLAIEGRSAGGLLVGAVVNMRPDLFSVALAGVPFVDVMNTMSDPSIPLTTGEWEEWGNPNEEKYFDYMLSYSPYDNVHKTRYPAMLVTSGLFDPRVAYWEPAKWVAKLRENNENTKEILLKMDLSSGHFSASDRYKGLRERSFELAFLLDRLGVLHAK